MEVSSIDDYYFCFGFHHGSDRAWQMDYFRRVAQGKNAEVLGWSQLKNDLMMRLLNLEAEASRLWKTFNNDQKKWLEVYSQGVNEGFKIGKNAQEFQDLNYSPEEWKPEDSLAVLLLQSFDQTRKTFFRDYTENKLRNNFGDKAQDLFGHNDVPWDNSILKHGEYGSKKLTTKIEFHHQQKSFNFWSVFPSLFGESSGSNNWVISKNKSKTGNAILANDPHLDLKTPLFWYWIHLKSSDSEVIGASLPGVPVVVSGTNGHVSWGLTNSYIKTAQANFLKKSENDVISSFWPLVWVKWGRVKVPFFFKRFEILNNFWKVLPLETSSDEKIVLSWTGFHLSADDLDPMFNFFKAKNVAEFDDYLKKVGIPSWNFVFADNEGDIGFRVIGRAYKILGDKPWGMERKTTYELKNLEFLSTNEMPHVLNPPRNYIYTANNRHWPKDAELSGGRGYTQSFRGFRIDELLKEDQDLVTTKNTQCDDQAVDARFLVPLFISKLKIDDFKNWDYIPRFNSKVTSLYRRFVDIIFEKWEVDEYALYRILKQDLDLKKRDELKSFFNQAKNEVGSRKWQDFHRLSFPHLSQSENWNFSPEISGIGDTHSINPGTSKWNEDLNLYEQTSGASMRLVIVMTERPKIYLSLPGKNREYQKKSDENPWQNWSNCQYARVQF